MVAEQVEGTSRFVPSENGRVNTDNRDMLAKADAFLSAEARNAGLENRSVPVFSSLDGRMVVNRMDSHVSGHACNYLATAISKIDTQDREFIVEEVVFPVVLGFSLVVETTPQDDIWYGVRPRRPGLSRFVMNREPDLTSSYTVILKRRAEDVLRRVHDPNHQVGYVLITGYIGRPSVPEPDDILRLECNPRTPKPEIERLAHEATAQRMKFWENHAFVLHANPKRSALVWPATLTKEYPWNGRRRFRHEQAGGNSVVVTPFLKPSNKSA